MKKLFFLFTIVVSLLLVNSFDSSGQARLHIVQLDSFPEFPGDTAYDGQVYHNIRIVVTNVGTNNFFGEIDAYLYSQSIGMSGLDTLRNPPGPPQQFLLQPGDTISLPANPNYRFKNIHYAAGDNIIVVWPYNTTTQFDTYQSRVYFAQTVGVEEPEEMAVSIFPNPSSGILHLNYKDEIAVKQVRIIDISGRLVFAIEEAIQTINMSPFDEGIYFLEIVQKDEQRAVKKISISRN